MFDFRKISFDDKDWINSCLEISDFQGCEYTFANNIAWQRMNDTKICHYKEFYISCYEEGGWIYVTFPAGVKLDKDGWEKYFELFELLKKHFSDLGKKFAVSSVTNEQLKVIKNWYGKKVTSEYSRDSSDYIYKSEDLINFSGKKYHGKRNHVKHFYENEWTFEDINERNVDECIVFAASFYNDSGSKEKSAVVEQYAINLFLMNMERLNLKGGVMRVNGEAVGFTLGERLNSNTFVVHIEKANSGIQGAYPAICNQFAKANADKFTYINREEDMGIEGLRKSKLSYHPVFLVDKNIVYFN